MKLKLLTLCVVVLSHLSSGLAFGQQSIESELTPATQADPRFKSPRDTIITFRRLVERWLQDGIAADPSIQSTIADSMGFRGVLNRNTAGRTGERLYYVLNRLGPPELWLPRVPDRASQSMTSSGEWVLLPNPRLLGADEAILEANPEAYIGLVRDPEGRWVFDDRTIQEIVDLQRSLRNVPVADGLRDESTGTVAIQLERLVPAWLSGGGVLGVANWQIALLLIIIFIGFAADLAVRAVLRILWARVARSSRLSVDPEVLQRTLHPFGRAAQAIVWYLGIGVLSIPEPGQGILLVIAQIALAIALAWASWHMTDLVGEVLLRQALKTRSRVDDLLVPLFRKTLKILVVVFGVIYGASALNIPILPLLGGLGVGGVAVAFAAKDTIENLFGSIAVVLDRPFEVGDWITIDDVEGNVEELGLRSTRIRTFYNSLVSVPNASLVRAKVDNYGRRRFRRFKSTISVSTHSTPEQIEAFCEGIREIVRKHPYTRKDSYNVWVNDWSRQSLEILIYIFHETPDWDTELRERHRFILDTHRLAKRLGIDTAPPERTELQRASEPEQPDLDPVDRGAERAARQHGMQTVRTMTSEASWNEARPSPVVYTTPEEDH